MVNAPKLFNPTIATLVIIAAILQLVALPAHGSWLIYHKPEFKGQVVDIETKEPVEGAVVVAVYKKTTLNPPAGSYTNVIEVRETLTDKNGTFNFHSYTTLIHPFSYSDNCDFIIYKPGYGNLGELGLEDYFSGNAKDIWEMRAFWNKKVLFRFLPNGTIELPKITSKEERTKAKPIPAGDFRFWKKQKIFIQTIRKEWSYLTGQDSTDLYRYEDQ
ncbi:carboxypeptidase-like regulatory domain-containing protein [Geobacter sulfurreducens]|uniref:carboxypeptidase-like regulatory domain-containing protein n=1 Tax=Geobacter sulfurreducens TaxID=35554 RepID=UPI000DBB99EB|nr:carboxypeptidase-like regulatory domain-containing protein [Geobacter sulfurreducens]BBA69498.1 hypothetical protein YM18_0951 [Geobacter sulfurreducens]